MPDPIHVAVYGEVNANLIDGSSIWLQSICLTIASVPGARVTVLLRSPESRDLVTGPLGEHPRVRVLSPDPEKCGGLLSASAAVDALGELDDFDPFDFVVLRGPAVAAAASERFGGRIWLYHVPVAGIDPRDLARYAGASHRILCQTEAIRREVEVALPEMAAQTLILPPMVPAAAQVAPLADGPIRRLFYAGKISPEYFALEMVELLTRLRVEIPAVELHVAGDKIHDPPQEPEFHNRARGALEATAGLRWHGAVQRAHVAELLGSADVGLSLRHPSLDDSAELSTKVLEYGAAGRPVLLNSTPLHRELLGEDYPLLAGSIEEAVATLVRASADPGLRREAARRVAELSSGHTFDRVAAGLAPHLEASPGKMRPAARSPRLLVAGHNQSFAGPLLDRAAALGVEVREDSWTTHSENDEETGLEGLEWADTILCEWCLGNAVWYSRRKRPGQRLIVRFHRMEVETKYPSEVDLDQVDLMIFVAGHVLEDACEKFGWPAEDPRLLVVPNGVDAAELRREKLPRSAFTIGMVGYVPWIKRIDRALDLLERLRARDKRYRLIVKGRGPWEYSWMAGRERERRLYDGAFRRIERSPLLGPAVAFEPFGDDLPEYLQQIRWIFSGSEIEGHSVALAEGMTSGAVPVVIERPGAGQQYEQSWVHSNADSAAVAILACQADGWVSAAGDAAAAFAGRWDWEEVGPVWDRLLGFSGKS